VKILVDMNLSPAWVPFWTSEGFQAVHWSAVGDPRAPDDALMTWARTNDHVVFTHDLDFSTLIAKTAATGPSVLQVRTLDLLPGAIGADVVRVLKQHHDEISSGAIVTLDATTARLRILPIRGR
jgi:predicted nuclease of predicted toxin-antitoxin system